MNDTPEARPRGRRRVVLLDVQPQIDDGRYPVKKVCGDSVVVSCDLVADGHDLVSGLVEIRAAGASRTQTLPLTPVGNDRFTATFTVAELGIWEFVCEGWIDEYRSYCHGLARKHAAKQPVDVELLGGRALLESGLERAKEADLAAAERAIEHALQAVARGAPDEAVATVTSPEVTSAMAAVPDRRFSTRSRPNRILVDRERAGFSAWYELFPRSFGADGKHGTFSDVERALPYVASMGFDVLYFPPIHPIGTTHRKGPNNSLTAAASDPGSPWAIGGAAGGHKAIHPELGTVQDFVHLVDAARAHGLEIALDIAFQASPDHPYVKQNPEWFVHRADGTIQYAENPPKKYQDVYPFDLAGPAWEPLWAELKSVFDVWIERGVRIFRVDNPHTKPIPFWEYCIAEIRKNHPDVLFLAEAFTRPKLMYCLAKVGFSQSYTYFTWRTTGQELAQYMRELTTAPVRDFFRPNFWPNTPDILPEHLQHGGRAMFVARMILAGTLSANWGIYGPAFELMEHLPRPGAEEYVDNEKFQLRRWDLDRADSLRPLIARLNKIRKENPALQRNDQLVFHASDNPCVLVYSKSDPQRSNVVLTVVNLETHHRHTAWLTLDLATLGIAGDETFQVHDLMSDARYHWRGARVFVDLDPEVIPAHILRIRRHLRRENDFEYFL